MKNGFVLSKSRNLKKLELIDLPCIPNETLSKVIHDNLGLESLCIKNEMGNIDATKILVLHLFDKLMMMFESALFNHLKEYVYAPLYFGQNGPSPYQIKQPDHIVDAFVDSLKHLESLASSFAAVNYFTDVV